MARVAFLFLKAVVDKMKPLGCALTFATTKGGSAHICMTGPSVQLGAEFRELSVLPANVKAEAEEIRCARMHAGFEAVGCMDA